MGLKQKTATMRDVAKLAGVTQPTVSYVINNTANVSDEVRQRVNEAIKELNYTPNYFARGLKTNKSSMVGIVIPDILNEFYASIVSELEKKMLNEHFRVVVHSTNYDPFEEKRALAGLLDYNVDAIIMAYQPIGASNVRLLKRFTQPVVVLEGGAACQGIACINTDNFYGGYTATKYLINQGRKRLAYIGQNNDIEALRERCRGFQEALREHGLSETGQLFETSGPGNKWEEGIKLGEKLLPHSLDGIVVSSDVVAVGILKTLLFANKRVPEDIAVVGYDDIPLAKLFVPALTTIAQPLNDMCSKAVEKVMQGLDGKAMVDELIKPQLIIRETA